MTRNVLLVIIIVLLLWNAVILCDIRQASYDTKNIQRDKGSEPPKKPGKPLPPPRLPQQERPQKPGKLIPNPALPQWNL